MNEEEAMLAYIQQMPETLTNFRRRDREEGASAPGLEGDIHRPNIFVSPLNRIIRARLNLVPISSP